MMSETAVQSSVCEACGVDVRDESLFCYNCGERVTAEVPLEQPVPESNEPGEPVAGKNDIAVQPASRPPLKSAASLRKQRRASNRQPVEVSWEQRSGQPVTFILATIVLTLAALVLLAIALYLR